MPGGMHWLLYLSVIIVLLQRHPGLAWCYSVHHDEMAASSSTRLQHVLQAGHFALPGNALATQRHRAQHAAAAAAAAAGCMQH